MSLIQKVAVGEAELEKQKVKAKELEEKEAAGQEAPEGGEAVEDETAKKKPAEKAKQ